MSEQNFAISEQLQQVLARMASMQAELDSLKTRTENLPQVEPTSSNQSSKGSSTRRKTLKRLGLALLGGAAAATISGFSVSEAEMVVSPASANGQVGTLIAPPHKNVPTGNPSDFAKVGLVSTDGVDLNLSLLPGSINGYYAGVLGYSGTDSGNGLVGLVSGTYANAFFGYTTNTNSYGLYAHVDNTDSYAVYGNALKARSYAGYFDGNVYINGTLNATSATASVKNFKIDHPLDPANKYLYHTSVESPDMKNIYDGVVTLDGQGEATVTMPDWFEALNADFRYQLTSIGVSMPGLFIAEKLSERRFKIAGGKAGQEVSWQVTGIRQDAYAQAHRSPVEQDKTGNEKGKYIHPELFGQPKEMSVSPRPPARAGASR